MTLATKALAAGVIWLGLTVGAHATVAFDDLSLATNVDSNGQFSSNGDGFAMSFTTGASGLDLSDVSLALSGGSTSSMLVVTLFSDNSGTLGTSLYQIRQVLDSDVNGSMGSVYDFQLTTAQSLTANTTYWIEVTDSGTANLAYQGGNNGIGVADESNYVAGGAFAGYYPNSAGISYGMCVADSGGGCSGPAPTATFTTDSSAPEPASLAILGVAVLGLGAIRRYRKAA